MPQSYFIWKNKDCRSMGVIMRGPAPIIRAEERVKHVEIPGRSGDLTETEGEEEEKIYNSYIQTVEISVRGGFRVREIYKWLRGAGYVTFSGEPDRRQQARVIGAITLDKVSRNIDHWAGTVQFYCQPLKEKLQEETVTITSSGTNVQNAGDERAKPRITMTASGTNALVSAGGKSILCMSLTIGNTYVIDSATCEVVDITTPAEPVNCTNQSTGEFPVLKPGQNSVTGSGWSQLVIEKRERFL